MDSSDFSYEGGPSSDIIRTLQDSHDVKHDLTGFLARVSDGDVRAAREQLPEVYDELRAIAAAYFREPSASGHTLQATALVNEAYIKLSEAGRVGFRDRKHFFVLVAKVMRQVLVDHARAKRALKRGGGQQRITLSGLAGDTGPSIDVLALEEAMTRLSAISPQRAQLVELRFFSGMPEAEAAEALGISRAEASRQWRAARAWLAMQMREGGDDDARAVRED